MGKIYIFSGWQLDTRLNELSCAGKPFELEPKVFDVLLYLIEHRDRVVSNEELIDHFWPEQALGKAALVRSVMAARQTVGDNGKDRWCITTVRGRGYRFVAFVEERVDAPLPLRSREGHLRDQLEAATALIPPPRRQVAKLAGGPLLSSQTPQEEHIDCTECQQKNTVRASFCVYCGAQLAWVCPSCGQAASPHMHYCSACGTHLMRSMRGTSSLTLMPQGYLQPAGIGLGGALVTAPRELEAERRHLTLLFCDLVDSTPLAVNLDLEELRDVVHAYHTVCTEVIERFDGYIAQFLGDGLLVYFGYPRAHEDDAQRAVRTGLGIIEALKPLQTRLHQERGVSLGVRVGIHTGLVVVGDVGEGTRHERLALGEVPNLAARLQGLAEPDTVLISAITARLVQGWFVCEALGDQTLKGFPAPMPVYRVLEESGVQSRLDIAAVSGLTPLIGRDQEVKLLLESWERAKDGQGQIITLSGEAGIGKTRLLLALQERLADEQYTRLECRCSPYAQHSALFPVITLGRRLLKWQRDEPPELTQGKLEAALAPYDVSLPEAVPLLASLLSLRLSGGYSPLQLTPQRQKQKTLEIILALLRALAAQRPVLLIVEDLHWIDSSTLELLSLFIDQDTTARILALLTSRWEFHLPWGDREHVTAFNLGRLAPMQVERMIEQLTGGKRLPVEVHQQVVTKTDGVPLFVEELTKMVLESGLLREQANHYELRGSLPSLAIPTTLHDSLMARLDRLASAKEVAQLGATLGRTFSYELLRAVSPWDEERLQHALGQLVEAELLHQRGVPPDMGYTFKHALIQETAYQSLLKSKRQQYHQQTVRVLEQDFPEIAETQPELLAHHYTEAGLPAQALPYWQRAGQHAVERSANVEAISHFTKGLEVLQTLPDTPERTHQELTLQLALGSPLLMVKGHTAPEVEQTYTRSLQLCQQAVDSLQRFSALVGLWRFHLSKASLRTAHELAKQCFTLAERLQRPAFLQEANLMLGSTLFYLGEFTLALVYLEQAIAVRDPQQGRSLAFSAGTHPGVTSLSYLSWTLWILGYPNQALTRSDEAVTLAHELSHAYSLGFALHFASKLHIWRREVQLVREKSDAVIALAGEHGFVRWLGGGMLRRGWALAEQGRPQEAITELYRGLSTWQAMGGELGLPTILAQLAEAYNKGGRAEEGLLVLARAMTMVNKNEDRYYEAGLIHLKGELLLQRVIPDEQQAEANFHRALDVALHQRAKSLELRAMVSLSRLWRQQGKGAEAQQMLAATYGWFTEGFNTADLQEAKALLEELA